MNTDGTGFLTCKECHKTESLWNHTTADHKEGEHGSKGPILDVYDDDDDDDDDDIDMLTIR